MAFSSCTVVGFLCPILEISSKWTKRSVAVWKLDGASLRYNSGCASWRILVEPSFGEG